MIFNCEHGFYTFTPEDMDDQAHFQANTGYKLVRLPGGKLTFALLAGLPDYSIKGAPYGNLTAHVNYAGHPAGVLRANGFVFDLQTGTLKELSALTQPVQLYAQQNGAYIATALPQAGAKYKSQRLLSFTGVSRFGNQQFILRTYELQN